MKTPANPGPTRRPTPGRRPLTAAHRIVGLCLPVLLLPVTGACGDSGSGSAGADPKGSGSASTLDTDFSSRAEAACAPYADYQAKTFLDLQRFNRYAPDPQQLPRVATHLEQNPAYKTLVSDLEGLGAPASGATAWDAVLDDFRENALAVQAGIDAARSADAGGFADFAGQLEQDKTQLFKDLQTAGLGGSSCAAAEVDPLKPPPEQH
jgi:hypothetical protein